MLLRFTGKSFDICEIHGPFPFDRIRNFSLRPAFSLMNIIKSSLEIRLTGKYKMKNKNHAKNGRNN